MKKQNTNKNLTFNKVAIIELNKGQIKNIIGGQNSGEKCENQSDPPLNPFASYRCKY
jgi:natural product precursor